MPPWDLRSGFGEMRRPEGRSFEDAARRCKGFLRIFSVRVARPARARARWRGEPTPVPGVPPDPIGCPIWELLRLGRDPAYSLLPRPQLFPRAILDGGRQLQP